MPDFHQEGIITTLHALHETFDREEYLANLERKLDEVDMMLHTYYQNALGFIRCYSEDANVNDLDYDRYQEELTARYFQGFLWTAWEQSKGPRESTLIPCWNLVFYSLPNIYTQVLEAVEADDG